MNPVFTFSPFRDSLAYSLAFQKKVFGLADRTTDTSIEIHHLIISTSSLWLSLTRNPHQYGNLGHAMDNRGSVHPKSFSAHVLFELNHKIFWSCTLIAESQFTKDPNSIHPITIMAVGTNFVVHYDSICHEWSQMKSAQQIKKVQDL